MCRKLILNFFKVLQTNNEGTDSQASGCTDSQASGFAVPISNTIFGAVSSQKTPTNEELTPSTATASSVRNTPRAKKRTKEILTAVSDLKKINEDLNSEEETVWAAFGKSVAMQLKTMSVENALLAQCRIQSILTEFGLKDHREKTASRSAMSNYSNRRTSSALSDTDISFVDSPNIYLGESVASPPQASPVSPPEQIIIVTPRTKETSTTQTIYTTSSDSSPAQLIYTAATQYSNYDNDIITAAMNAASAFQY